MNNTSRPTPPLAHDLLLIVQALGTLAIDALRWVLNPHGVVRQLPLVRIAAVTSMLVLIVQSDLHMTIQLGSGEQASTPADVEQGLITPQPAKTLLAGFFTSSPSTPSHDLLDDSRVLEMIERFEHVAIQEEQRFGIPAGVLLVAAGAASADVDALAQNNHFGGALTGEFGSAWESWRAMSLTVAAAPGAETALTRQDWIEVVANLYAQPDQKSASLSFLLERFSL